MESPSTGDSHASTEPRANPTPFNSAPTQHAEHEDACSEPNERAKPLEVPEPEYPEDARAAGVEGRVRVEITVDTDGSVVDARVIQSLGHGCDEAALSAVRRARFEPATRCGRPVRSTFSIGIRFSS